jgi:hypothetical protein
MALHRSRCYVKFDAAAAVERLSYRQQPRLFYPKNYASGTTESTVSPRVAYV